MVRTEVALENARITLEDTSVRAPSAGTIIEKTVEPGIVITSPTQAVSGGTVLMKMADLTSVQVRTRVDETDIGKIQPGMQTLVTVAAYPNQPFDGVVLKIEPQAIVEQNVTMFAVLIKLAEPRRPVEARHERGGADQHRESRRRGRGADRCAARGYRRGAVGANARCGRSGTAGADLARDVSPRSRAPRVRRRTMLNLGGREIELPEGVDAKAVTALAEKRRGGQELTADERELMRRVFQQAGGLAAGGGGLGSRGGAGGQGGPAGGNFPPGGSMPPGGFPGGAIVVFQGPGGPGGAAPARGGTSNYQFGGEYWVVALRNDQPVPVAVRTGLTDLEYSEIVSGLEPGDRVLLLPSTSLYEQQERLQQFISQRFGSSTPFQQNQQQNIPRQFR